MTKGKAPVCRSFAAGEDGPRPWEQIPKAQQKALIQKRMLEAAREAGACILEEIQQTG